MSRVLRFYMYLAEKKLPIVEKIFVDRNNKKNDLMQIFFIYIYAIFKILYRS